MEQSAAGERRPSSVLPPISAESFTALYLPRVLRFALMVSPPGAEPEDVAQEAMITALARLATFDPSRGSMEDWLWRIVVSRARDAGRAARRWELLLERLLRLRLQTSAASPESLALQRIRDQDLVDALRRLPRRYRTIIALRYGAGLSSPEIADALGTTSMAVKKALRRALDRLRAGLEVSDEED